MQHSSSLAQEYVAWEDLGRISDAWRVADGTPGSPFDPYRGKFLPLPGWYDQSLAPLSPEYLAQQDRLWQLMIGAEARYQPDRDEQTGVDEGQVLVRPGFYRGPLDQAGDHLIAMGHILRVCGLRPGDRVLEYGAGYGQIALTLARLGVIVDTIDIDPGFCSAVNKQAEWFGVGLTAYRGEFGDNPTGQRYAMILFYEAFHHARNFQDVIARARDILEPGGRIVMAGEPVQPNSDPVFAKLCPYPWVMRLDVENAAIVRFRHWYELGFREEFLFDIFESQDFIPRKFAGQISHCATVYSFTLRSDTVRLGSGFGRPEIEMTWWDGEPEGRWTRDVSLFSVLRNSDWSTLRIACVNYHAAPQTVDFELGDVSRRVVIEAHQDVEVITPRSEGAKLLRILTNPITPMDFGIPDHRALGIFVKSIEHLR